MAASPAEKPRVPEPIRHPTPRQRFLLNGTFLKEHHNLVDSSAFERGCDYALLQYQRQLSESVTDAVGAGAAGLKMKGVMEFLAVLRSLADTSLPPQRRPDDNLQH